MKRMWGVKKVFSFMFLALTGFVLLTACGGGGGSDGGGGNNNQTPPPATNATITGTVAGTTVKAFDLSGNEVASNTATGNPKTFSLNVPANGSYKFYLIENEGTASERVYALYQGTTNVFNIASAVTIDLGFVDTSTGVAVPTNNPLNVSGVTSGGENTTIPASLAISAFTISDLQGTWNFRLIISGDSPSWSGVGSGYGTFTIDNAGNRTFTSYTRNNGVTTLPPADTISITSSGIVSFPATPVTHGVMSQDKNMIVGTDTGDTSDYVLFIAHRAGGTFTSSDLVGTWNWHSITAGDAPGWLGWIRGEVNIDVNGNFIVNSFLDSDGDTTAIGGTIAISTDGTTTLNSANGKMNQSKDIILVTDTYSGIEYELGIFTKAGGTFSQSDLTGTWNLHGLTSGDNPPQWIGWSYGGMNIDNSGALAFSFMNRSDGDTSLPSSDSLSITSSGIVSSTGIQSFHGAMTQSKDLIVGTMTDSGGGYDLVIFMK